MKITKKNAVKILINPFYAINIHESLVGDHVSMVSESEWIKTNKKLIDDIGAENWLEMLLDILKGNYISEI